MRQKAQLLRKENAFIAISLHLGPARKHSVIQPFRQRLSYKSVKAYATMSIGIVGGKSLVLPD